MVGVFVLYLAVLHISFIQSVNGGLTCPKGITSFSHGVRSNTYYACEEDGGQPVMKTCEHGQFYWAYMKACYDTQDFENSVKTEHTDMKIYSRRILGDPVFLGDLYNANTGEVRTGFSFWNRDTILKNKMRRISPSSSVDIFATRSTIDRLQRAGFSVVMELDVLGNLIRIKRSFAYINDRLESENEVAVILSYQATTQTETLPVSTPKDFDYCKVSDLTHVITSVTYGIGANFVFKKSIGDGESRDEVEKNLKIAVDAVPTTKTDITDSIKEIVKDVRVKFFADFVSKKQPTSYQESVRMYQSLSDRVGELSKYANNTVAVEVQLMPITNFCERKRTMHIAVASDILNSVNEMLGDIEKTKLIINTLKMEKSVRNYVPLKKILQRLFKELTTFELHIKTELQGLLPRIHRGNSSEEELILLLNKYAKSPFYSDNVETFLRNRRREVSSLNYVLNPQKLQGTDVKVLNYEEASDFKTMFIKPFVLMLKYNVLPSNLLVRKFLKGETVDESKAWYNNLYVISAMGIQFNKFVHFSSANKNSKSHGYLLAISDAKDVGINDVIDDVININAQKEGLLYTFKFPDIPPKMTSTSNTHQSMTFTATRPSSTWVVGFSISHWHHEKQDEVTSKTYQFSKNNETTVKVDELIANKLYDFAMQYVTPMGLSPPSPTSSFYTRPCSPPTNLRMIILSANYFKMEWDAPLTCGKKAHISKYRITVTGGNNFSKTIIVDGVTNVEVRRLKPVSNYMVAIEAITDTQMFNGTQKDAISITLPSTISFMTRPDAPSHLALVNRSIHSAVIDWVAPTKIATGAVIEKYRVKYAITNYPGNVTKRGTEMVVSSFNTSCHLTDLIRGTTYAVSVQVLTTKGDSDYSTSLLITTMSVKSGIDRLRIFVKREMDRLSDSLNLVEILHNSSIAAVETEIVKQKEEVDDTIKSIINIQSLMVFYPRLRSNGYLTDSASGCGGTINTAGELRYPSYEGYYNRYNEDCTWTINTGLPTTLYFSYWSLHCGDHYVSVHDEELFVKKSCSPPLGTIHTHSGNVHVRYHTGSSSAGRYGGFHVTISVTDTKRMAAQRYYPKHKATFIGYGAPKSYSQHHTWKLPKSNSSITACIQDCNERYVNNHTWSEMSIELEGDPLQCACYKDPVGFVYSLSKFQYRML